MTFDLQPPGVVAVGDGRAAAAPKAFYYEMEFLPLWPVLELLPIWKIEKDTKLKHGDLKRFLDRQYLGATKV